MDSSKRKFLVFVVFCFLGNSDPIFAQNVPAEEFIIPLFVTGVVDSESFYASEFSFLNLATSTAEVTVKIFDDQGENASIFCSGPVPVPGDSEQRFVPPNGLGLVRTDDARSLISGWAKVRVPEATPVQVAAELVLLQGEPQGCPAVICNLPSTEKLADVRIAAVKPARTFSAQATRNANRHTAFSIVNPSQETATLEFTIFDEVGVLKKITEFQLEAGQQIRLFLNEFAILDILILPPDFIPKPFRGTVLITSDVPIAVAGLDVLFPEGKLLNLPVN